MNFMGLGINFGAKDIGLSAGLKNAVSGLTDVTTGLVGAGAAAAGMILKPPDIRPALGMFQQLASDVHVNTNMIEQFGASSSKATSAGLAGLNLSASEFKKLQSTVASTTWSMNTDIGGVTKSMVALKQSSVDVKKVGFKSFNEFQRFISVTGTDATKFASAIGKMNNQMGMTPEMTTDVIQSVTAIGKKFNIGREAIAAMSDTVDLLNQNTNLLPQNWSPDRMAKFIKGTTIVSGALTKVGFTADEAIAGSKGLSQALLKGNAGMAALYSGLENDIPDLAQVLTENLGSYDEAFKKLQESPEDFMAGMGKMVDDVGKMNLNPESFNRFRIQMEKQFGPAAMAVFTKKGFGQIGPAIKEAKEPIKDQDKILSQMANRYQDGRVAADYFAIAQARMANGLKHVNGVMSDTSFLKKYNEGIDKSLAGLNEYAKQDGVVGEATRMLVDFKNHGIGGTLAAMHPLGMVVAELGSQFMPILQVLPGIATAFSALLSPITLIVGGIAAMIFAFRDLQKGQDSVIRNWAKKIDWDAVAKTIWDGMRWVFNGIVDIAKAIDWEKVGHYVAIGIGAALSGLWEVFKWGAGKAWEFIKEGWSDIWDGIKSGISDAWDWITGSGDKSSASTVKQLNTISDTAKDVGNVLMHSAKGIIGSIASIADKSVGYVKNVMGGVEASEMAAIQSRLAKRHEEIRLISNREEREKALGKLADDASKANDDYYEKYGIALSRVHNINDQVSMQYAMTDKFVISAKSHGDAYYRTIVGLQADLSKGTADLSIELQKLIDDNKGWTAEAIELRVAVVKSTIEGVTMLAGSQDVLNGKFSKTVNSMASGSDAYLARLSGAADAWSLNIKNSATKALGHVNSAATQQRDRAKKMIDDIADAESKAMYEKFSNTKLQGAELDKAQSAEREKYESQARAIVTALDKASSRAAGSQQLQHDLDASEVAFSKLGSNATAAATKVHTAITDVTGMTGDESTRAIIALEKINPEHFRGNIDKVQASFLKLFDAMSSKADTSVKKTMGLIKAYWDQLEAGWNNSKTVIESFGSQAETSIQKYWNKVMELATKSVLSFVGLVKTIEVNMSTMAQSLNIMDVLAAPDQITRWAASVVAALAYAFKHGGAIDPLIEASYAKALSNAAMIGVKAGAATPDASASSQALSSSDSTTKTLMDVMNRPQWVNDGSLLVPATLVEMNANIRRLLEKEGVTPEPTKPSGGAPGISRS